MPVFGKERMDGARAAISGGCVAVLVSLWLPLFSMGSGRGASSYSLWDLREVGTPGVPLLAAGAVALFVGTLASNRIRHADIRAWLAGIALAETLGVVVALSIGFSLAIHERRLGEITFHPGLLVLIAGLAACLVGALRQREPARD